MASKVQIPLKVLIFEEEKRVLFAEGNADFVDILLSFLTLPMGTIVKILSKHSSCSLQPLTIGCFNNLYRSISNLEVEYFATQRCKDLLLNTRNSAEAECKRLKINIDDNPMEYFTFTDMGCTENSAVAYFSMYPDVRCKNCSRFLNRKAYFSDTRSAGEAVFVKPKESFIITENLYVGPNIPAAALTILEECGSTDFEVTKEKTFQIGYSEILDLLKYSIVSKTPLTNMIFRENKFMAHNSDQTISSRMSTEGMAGFKNIAVNVWVLKASKKILLAHCTEEFIDFLFSLLTVPLGRAISLLNEDDKLASCVKNLHQNVSDMDFLTLEQMKDTLLCPESAMLYLCSNPLFPLKEDRVPKIYRKPKSSIGQEYYVLSSSPHSTFREMKLASPMGEKGFLKGSTKFMVTDDVVVTPFSSMSCIKYVKSCKIPSGDIEDHMVDIGIKEAVNLLRASLISTSVLTNGLKHLILVKPEKARLLKKPKVET